MDSNKDDLKILYVDLDGVVADFREYISSRSNFEIDFSSYEGKNQAEVERVCKENSRLFYHLKYLEGSIEAVEVLRSRNKYDIYFLSKPMWIVPESYTDKRLWIEKHFGEWAYNKLILSAHKNLNLGDYIIDDTLNAGVDKFQGEHIHIFTPKFPDWDSVLKYLP